MERNPQNTTDTLYITPTPLNPTEPVHYILEAMFHQHDANQYRRDIERDGIDATTAAEWNHWINRSRDDDNVHHRLEAAIEHANEAGRTVVAITRDDLRAALVELIRSDDDLDAIRERLDS
jgi:hypothetical protein